jgi:AraC-like DNA-binding protein
MPKKGGQEIQEGLRKWGTNRREDGESCSDSSLLDIALDAGFSDQSQFCNIDSVGTLVIPVFRSSGVQVFRKHQPFHRSGYKTFKLHTGLTPTEFRKIIRSR